MSTITGRVIDAEATSAGRCQIVEAGIWCLDPGVSTWTAGCAHEHVVAGISVCADHEWRMTGRPWNCLECAQGDGAHECLVLVTRAGAS